MTELLGNNEERRKDAKWYVVHTYSGHENKVKATIEQMVASRGYKDNIFEVIVPMESYQDKNNPGKLKTRKSFPGYVLVNMINDTESWFLVRNTRGVTGFVGPSGDPVPLTDRELKSLGMTDEISKKPVDVEIGDRVLVMTGPFKDKVVEVKEVKKEERILKVLVDMFGQENIVDIDYDQVEKI